MPKQIFIWIFCAIPFLGIAQNPKWKEWEVQADTLMQRENFKEAVKLYTKIIAESKLKEPSDYNVVYKRAVGYYRNADFQLALADLEVLQAKNPQIPQIFIMRALIHRELGDADKQLENLESAIELTGDPGLIKWRAGLKLDKGNFEEAKRDLLAVRTIQPDPETETQLGFAFYSLEETDSAMQCINKAIELDPSYMPAYYYAGSFCLQEEQYDLGLKYLNLGLRLEPTNASLIFYKGIALIELKRTEEGCRFLKKAFDAGEDDAADYLIEYCYQTEK